MKETFIKALLIEDSLVYAQLVLEMVKEARGVAISIEHSFRLSTGLERLRQEKFDIVLLDLTLPDSFGLETIKKTRAEAGNLPIVIMTSLDDEEFTIQALQMGAQDYLVKGEFDTNLLVRSIRYAIERKFSEVSLRESEQLLSAIFREIPSLISITTLKEGLYIDINNAFEKTTGYSRDEIIAHTATDLSFYADPSDREKMIRKMQREGLVQNMELNFRKKTGEIITCLVSCRQIIIKGQVCILSVLNDITEKKLQEEARSFSGSNK
ncbi:MAG: PAS domain S-box protein [Bacillota bacterium]